MPNVNFTYRNGRERTMGKNYADVLTKLGRGSYLTRDMRAAPPAPAPPVAPDDTQALRVKYEEIFGKRPFMGWDAATLRDKIAEVDE